MGLDMEPREFDSMVSAPEAQGRVTPVKGPVEMRDFDDPVAIRKNIFNGVKTAFAARTMENKEHVLRFADVDYDKPGDFTLQDEKNAILGRKRLYWNLRGRLQLLDKATGALISEDDKPRKLAEVPYVTRRGTFIHNGTEYLTSHQMRLKPGAYTRVQNNGDVETQFNVLKGSSFRVHMTPETGVFRINAGQAQMKLYPVLKALGIEDKALLEAWGKDLFNANKAADDKTTGSTVQKLVQRLGGHLDQELPPEEAVKRLPEIFKRMELDPEVMRRTLGKPHAGVDQQVLLDATKKILRVHQGTEEPDDRDDLPYQSFHGPEDFFREHVEKDAGQYLRQALWKAGFKKDVKGIPEGYFTKQLQSVILGSGLSSSLTEINPAEIYDMRHKITRLGEGGIGSSDVVPKGARGVQPTHFGFIDPLRAPECYDDKTEVMTREGWKLWSEVTAADEFACLIDGSLRFHHAEAFHVSDYQGLMYGASTDTVEYLVTPNHRMYTRCKDRLRNGGKCGYRIDEVTKVHNRARCVLSSGFGPYVSTSPALEFELPKAVSTTGKIGACRNKYGSFPMAQWAEFLGWYLTEGNVSQVKYTENGYAWVTWISQSLAVNPENVKRIGELLTEMGILWTYQESHQTFCISGKQLAQYLQQFGKSDEKFIPEYIFEASVEARMRFAEAALRGDGRAHRTGDRRTFTSCSRRFAHDFARLAFSLGKSYAISYYPDERKESYLGIYEVYLHTREEREVSHRMPRRGNAYFTQQYAGKVYCATVPGGLLYVRRSGKCGFWCGNSQKIALDLRTTQGTKVGSDGRLYQKFWNPRKQAFEFIHTDAAADHIIAFPGELEKAQGKPKQKVRAMVKGRMSYVPAAKVDYALPHASGMWSPLTWMVPFMSGVKGARVGMGARMQSQALALKDPEAPLVMPVHKDSGSGFHDAIGGHMGAVKAKKPGVVKKITPEGIEVQHMDGTSEVYETYNNMPFNQKGFIHNTPTVKPGEMVNPGTLLARSNYTDAKGRAALGRNVTAAWHMLDGLTHEDAIAISESAAKKFASEQMYEFSKERGEDIHEISKNAYISQYPSAYTKQQLERMDDEGVVLPGTVLKKGDPIILAVGKQRGAIKGSIMKGRKSAFSDAAETWDHDAEAEVVDVRKTPKGPVVTLKSYTPMQPGDKLCYSEDTEILTWEGWKKVSEVTTEDRLASLGACGELEYIQPVAVHSYEHSGRMYSLETTQVSLLVTANHSLYACPRDSQEYGLHRADALFGTRYKLKNNADVLLPGEDPEFKRLPDFTAPAGQGGAGVRTWKGGQISSKCYAFLLGAFLSEGCVLWQPSCGNFGICISQTKPEGVKRLLSALDEHGLRYSKTGESYVIYGKSLALLFSAIAPPGQGRQCHAKRIPQEVWGWTPELQFELFDWLVWGDGCIGETTAYYTTVSKGLAGDVQRLALHLGFAANIRVTPAKRGMIKEVEYDFRERYDVVFYLNKNHPEINHGHCKTQKGQRELWVDYGGKVYCPSLPRNHTLYVRRKGKAVWCGNSGLFGNKGVVSKIIPDAEMLQTSDGKPVDIVMNPMGIISRVNPASLAEAALGKIAKRTGKPYVVEGFPKGSIAQFALDELAKNGMSDTETIIDPKTGRHIRDVFVGVPYVMKLHHMSEGKMGARETAHYTMDGLPARGGPEGSKRFGFMEVMGIMAHGVPHFVQDMKLTRGQRNDEFWRMYRLGMTPATPRVSRQYQKFEAMLQGAGVSLRKKDGATQIFPATQKEIEQLGGSREITKGETVDFDSGDPVPGGLFDVAITGGQGGEHWSHIKLAEPLPNPLMEDPFRALLGLTKDKYREILAGREEYNGIRGPQAIRQALDTFNVPREIAATTEEIKAGKKSARDRLVKRLGYLKAFERLEAHPRDFLLDRVPVLPPKFRPVSKFQETTISADANFLYKDLLEANENLKAARDAFGDENTADARLQAYDAFKAVVGLGNPIQPETQERNVRGLLKQIVGTSPKYGNFQRRVVGNPVDFVGRSVIIPGNHLDIDEVGLPVDMMWTLFKPFTIRKLSRSGMPMQVALKEWKERTPRATKALMDEAAVRPVVINRAPTLHKYNLTGHFAKPVAGHAMQLSNLILKGHNADYDGDALNIHVPVGDKAVDEVKEKMLPSKMLYSTKAFDVHMLPDQGFVTGLFVGSHENKKRKPRTFASKADAVRAYRSGEIDADDPIVILRGT